MKIAHQETSLKENTGTAGHIWKASRPALTTDCRHDALLHELSRAFLFVGNKPNIRWSMCASATQPHKCKICKKSFHNKTSSEKYDILYYEI